LQREREREEVREERVEVEEVKEERLRVQD